MSIYKFNVKNSTGEKVSLSQYKGKVLLIVNTASKCGFAPQLKDLEDLYDNYKDRGFVVLAFPSNQFGAQEPGNMKDILKDYRDDFGVEFPIMQKIDVKGPHEDSLFVYLKEEQQGLFGEEIKWNFTKFLVDREGSPIKRYSSNTNPKKIKQDIEAIL